MRLWVKWLVIGLLSVLFGLFVLANPVAASFAVTLVAGAMFILSGAVQIWAGFSTEEGASKLIGIGLGALMLLLGLSLTFKPLEGIISLALVALIFIALNGVVRLVISWRMRETRLFWPMLASGALSILLAGYILANFGQIAPHLLGLLLGVELLFNGVGLIVLAIFLRTASAALRDKIDKKFES